MFMFHRLCFMCIAVILFSCNQKNKELHINRYSISIDSVLFASYADTVIADLVVKSTDKDDWWTEKCMSQLRRKAFIDTIFNEIYNERLIAYDYYTNKPLSIKEVKKIEKLPDYNRDIIGKFQFYEGWYYSNQQHAFIKKVYAIIFGYETYTDKGEVKGYKPLFKVVFE